MYHRQLTPSPHTHVRMLARASRGTTSLLKRQHSPSMASLSAAAHPLARGHSTDAGTKGDAHEQQLPSPTSVEGFTAPTASGAAPEGTPSSLPGAQAITIPTHVCDHTLNVLREHASNFKHVDKQDEPPLRVLELGLFGESAPEPLKGAPASSWIERNGRYFLGYRFDQDVVDENVHATPYLRSVFGYGDKNADAFFRNTLGYASGATAFHSRDDNVLSEAMREALLEPALRIFGEERNPEAHQFSRIYSLYANVLVPGQIINMHLDVPEFIGVDRSTCPNWLLVAAHCSGLFQDKRVRNITTVFYPRTAPGGALAVYNSIKYPGGANALPEAQVYPAAQGNAVVIDADSCYHHSEQARSKELNTKPVAEVPVPNFPPECSIEVLPPTEADGEHVWVVKDDHTQAELARYLESDLRFSISCKIHVFGSKAEVEAYEGSKTADPSEKLTGAQIISRLGQDLKDRGVLPADCDVDAIPLCELGPLFVKEYVAPTAPSSETVEALWSEFHA